MESELEVTPRNTEGSEDMQNQNEEDPRIRMDDMFLEISLPDIEEPDIFCAIRFGDIDMIRRRIREGYNINSKFTGKSYRSM